MKKLFLVVLSTFAWQQIYAQKFEASVQLNSGVAYYRGPGTESASFIVENGDASKNYTNNAYGNIQGPTYGLSADLKLVVAKHLLFGLQGGYEISKTKIDLRKADHTVVLFTNVSTSGVYTPQPIDGKTTFISQYININPYTGYRVNLKKVAIDLTFGADVAAGLSKHEKGSTSSTDNKTITTDKELDKPKTDIRLQYGIKLWYQKFGISAAYSRGSRDYTEGTLYNAYGTPSTPHMVYMDVIKLGLSYRLN